MTKKEAIDTLKLMQAQAEWDYPMEYSAAIDMAIAALAAQPQYEEITPEEAASEIANGSTMSAWYWLDDMIQLKQMGYAICKEKK